MGAAMAGGRGTGAATELLERPVGDGTGGVGATCGPSPTGGSELSWRIRADGAQRAPECADQGVRPEGRRDGVYDYAGGPEGAAGSLLRRDRGCSRDHYRESEARGNRSLDRVLRQHVGLANEPGRRAELARVGSAG